MEAITLILNGMGGHLGTDGTWNLSVLEAVMTPGSERQDLRNVCHRVAELARNARVVAHPTAGAMNTSQLM